MIKRLRPEVLDMLGLAGAIAEAVRLFNESGSNCKLEFKLESPEPPSLPQKIAITAYRVVQESLNNIVKHAQATAAMVKLRYDIGGENIAIQVSDNGCGFEPAERGGGFGLLGMRERVNSVGGNLRIDSKVGDGTVLTVNLPRL
jgi:two-component system sensor histidine kinase UhpB